MMFSGFSRGIMNDRALAMIEAVNYRTGVIVRLQMSAKEQKHFQHELQTIYWSVVNRQGYSVGSIESQLQDALQSFRKEAAAKTSTDGSQ